MKRRRPEIAQPVSPTGLRRSHELPGKTVALANVFRLPVALIIRLLLRLYNRFEIIGEDNLRTNRSLVLVANHCSHLDTLCLLAALPLGKLRRVFPAAASDYFFQNAWRRWIAAVTTNALPFARQASVRRSLSICDEVLANPGNILIMFPEGTRSPTGELQDFKSGIGALVAGRDVEVVPCFIENSFRAWPKGKRLPRPRKVRLIVGAARNYGSRNAGKTDVCGVTLELREAIRELRNCHAAC